MDQSLSSEIRKTGDTNSEDGGNLCKSPFLKVVELCAGQQLELTSSNSNNNSPDEVSRQPIPPQQSTPTANVVAKIASPPAMKSGPAALNAARNRSPAHSRSLHASSPLSAGRRLSVPRRLFDPKSLLDRDASPNPLKTCGRSVWREKDSKRKKDSSRRSVPSSFAPTMTHPIARLTKGEVMDWDSD